MAKVTWDVPVRYVNSQGETFVLQGDGLGFLDIAPLYGYAWSYTLANDAVGDGGAASGFTRKPREIMLTLRERGRNRAAFAERMDALHAASEVDALAETPGRLWLADQYMDCYLAVSGTVTNAPRNAAFGTVTINVLAINPFWCTERATEFFPTVSGEDPGDKGKKYDNRYEYRYGTAIGNNVINNQHYAPAPAIITIFGAAEGPTVTIEGNVYGISTSITSSQRLIIDGEKREIYAVGAGGARTDLFNARVKTGDAFMPITMGEHHVIANGNYRMTIKLIERRSQPRWIE